MSSIILSIGQNDVRDDIRLFRIMARSGATKNELREIWFGILALVEYELDRYPERLHPRVFFKGRVVFGDKGSPPMVRLYLHQLGAYLDAISTKNLPR